MEFSYLRTNLELTAGNLSQHLSGWKTPGSGGLPGLRSNTRPTFQPSASRRLRSDP